MSDAVSPYQWLDRLFREEERRLQRRLGRWLGCPAAAEDALQDAFLRLASSPCVQAAQNLPAYLNQVARHAAVDRLRSPAGRPSGHEVLSDQWACPAPLPDAVVVQRQRVRRFSEALATLPARQRAMVVAARVDGLSYDAIAHRHGTTPAAVEKVVARALRRMDAVLADDGRASP